MIFTTKKKGITLEVEHNKQDQEIWGFTSDECVVIDSRDLAASILQLKS